MENVINAVKARNLANEYWLNKPLKKILNEIEKRAKLGEMKMYYNDFISDSVHTSLIELGFRLKKTNRYSNIFSTEISW